MADVKFIIIRMGKEDERKKGIHTLEMTFELRTAENELDLYLNYNYVR